MHRIAALIMVSSLVTPAVAAGDEWGLGIRATGERTGSDGGGDDGIDMGGGALFVRWRISGLFGLELGAGGVRGKLSDGAFERKTGTLDLTAQFHLTPGSRWDLYLLAGVGAAKDEVKLVAADGTRIEQEFHQAALRGGVGIEYRWRHVGLGAEAALIGRVREDADDALPGDAVPERSAGGQLSFSFTYYF